MALYPRRVKASLSCLKLLQVKSARSVFSSLFMEGRLFVRRRGYRKKSKGWQFLFLNLPIKYRLAGFIAFQAYCLTNNFYYWQNSSCFASFFYGERCMVAMNDCGDQLVG
jgi:hypothetical protein